MISTSHGEGWGIPLMEAMSMGLPTMAVNWSGHLEYMNAENSYLFDYSITNEGTSNPHHQWATVEKTSVIDKLRYVYENQQEAKQKGQKARQDIVSHWDTFEVAKRMALMVKEISDDKQRFKKQQELRNLVHLGKAPQQPIKSFSEHIKTDDKIYYKMNELIE